MDKDGDNDGDNDGDGTELNGKDRGLAGRPEFTTEGTDREGTGDEGTERTAAHEGRASARNNGVNLIAFGDGTSTV